MVVTVDSWVLALLTDRVNRVGEGLGPEAIVSAASTSRILSCFSADSDHASQSGSFEIMEKNLFMRPPLELEEQSHVPDLMPDSAGDEQQGYYESSECSYSSEEHPDEVDPAVREDMDKLEDVFFSKGFKFRMIDRIGEGRIYLGIHHNACKLLMLLQEPSQLSTKPKICITHITRIVGTLSYEASRKDPLRLVNLDITIHGSSLSRKYT